MKTKYKNVIVYSTSWCPHCKNAKKLLKKHKIQYLNIDIEEVGISKSELSVLTDGGTTIPQIIINGKSIGGFKELSKRLKVKSRKRKPAVKPKIKNKKNKKIKK